MTATNVKVAFQTISVTSTMSDQPTTPVISAKTAPTTAVIPISSPLGCQITKIKAITKMRMAKKVIINVHLQSVVDDDVKNEL